MKKSIKEAPSVSVIIPCYNAEKTLIRTLQSLENQTFDDFEVVIINDGSTDRTHELISNKLKMNGLNMNYIIQENAGVSAARNRGLVEARGSFITFLDADDVYHRDFIKTLQENIIDIDLDTVVCCYSRDVNSVINEIDEHPYITTQLSHEDLLEFFMYRKGPSSFFTFIYKKEIIQEYEIFFNPKLKYGEDLEFIWRYLLKSSKGSFVNKAMYGYYDNPHSAMNNINWRITDVLFAIKNIENELIESNDHFYQSFKEYMFSRTFWAVQKDFCTHGQKDYFLKMSKEYDGNIDLGVLVKISKDWRIKFTSVLYKTNKMLFYYFFKSVFSIKKKLGV